MMFEHYNIAPYGRKDCGAPALHGLRHEIHDALMSIKGWTHSMVMEWLFEHNLPEKIMLMDAISELVSKGVIYGYYLNSTESLGAKLLEYYTPKQIIERLSIWGVKEVKVYYSFTTPFMELRFDTSEPAPEWKQTSFEQHVEGADEDLPF